MAKKKTRARSLDAGTAERPVFVTNPEVQRELLEASRVARGSKKRKRSGTSKLSGGDVDAAWDQTGTGEEMVGGSVSTPDQDIVEILGEAAGVTYQDDEQLDILEKVEKRDRKRWELNPASAEDYQEHNQRKR
ncbi:MAG: DUF6335 family protein [Acidobacteria bacterium]|nr:DUF6335 family protein [Acidobacteriota bacterium]MCI0623116.1 DUF6335 family protein [Acidobacteriota bacterium]MCI0720839.1 DUF6335 family protein [Acidobacteriota bacterium]